MSYETNYGTGKLGDYTISDGLMRINSYARVTAIEGNVLEIDLENASISEFEAFPRAGDELMIHCSATNNTDSTLLGTFFIAKIELVDLQTLTLDVNVEKYFTQADLEYGYYLQAVSVPHFDCLTLKDGAILSPLPFNPFKYHGGVLAFKCFDTLTFDGGNINLVDCGIPPARAGLLRPTVYQESAFRGELDSGELAGEENIGGLILNAGDGACFISARKIIGDENSRIGNPKTYGKANCRAAADTAFKPSNVTNIGGSSLFIAADSFVNFNPKMLAKYRSDNLPAGKGLARAYIATKSDLPPDGKLYARDLIADKLFLQARGVINFGDGSFGDFTNPKSRLNNFAAVKNVDGYRAEIDPPNLTGLAPLKAGALCLCQKRDNFFTVARVLDDSDDFYLDEKLPIDAALIWSVPQFRNFTFNGKFSHFNFYVACSDTCDLRGAKLDADVFILAKNLIVDETTRLYRPAIIIADQITGWNDFFLTQKGNLIFTNRE